jgi:flagellar motor switch/type III secretory pathway protein FliN
MGELRNFFKNSNNEKMPNADLRLMLNDISTDMEHKQQAEESKDADTERSYDLFIQKHGSIENYISSALSEKAKGYGIPMLESVTDILQSTDTKEDPSVIGYAALMIAKDMAMQMHSDHPMERMASILKSVEIARKVSDMLPNEDLNDLMSSIIGIIAVASMRLAELSAMGEGASLMLEEKRKADSDD